MEKIICGRKYNEIVKLSKDKYGMFVVSVSGEVYKETANELFAVQAFNEI